MKNNTEVPKWRKYLLEYHSPDTDVGIVPLKPTLSKNERVCNSVRLHMDCGNNPVSEFHAKKI
jgi:hypothetical protein